MAVVMDVDAESDSEFWNSLNLISTQPEEENTFSDTLQSYLGKPLGSSTNVLNVDACKVFESKSLPITTIISRIQAEESSSDTEQDDPECMDSRYPPPSFTGGKWKPTVSPVATPTEEPLARRQSLSVNEIETDDQIANDLDIVEYEEGALKDLVCAICDVTFTKAENLVIHLTSRKHRKNITLENKHVAAQLYTKYHAQLLKRSAYQCGCCTFAAVEHDDLVMHMKSQQHNENTAKLGGPLECVECNFLDYAGTKMLAHCMSSEHMFKSSNGSVVIKERKHQIPCSKCKKVLHSTLHYTRHMRYQHSRTVDPAAKIIYCHFCSFKGKPSAVNQHVSRTHRNERPFLCQVCQTDFHSKYDLMKHYSTKKHLDNILNSYKDKIFVKDMPTMSHNDQAINAKRMKFCKYCPYATCELSNLQLHYTKDHKHEHADDGSLPSVSSLRPVYCRYCFKRQPNKSQLFVHEMSHIQKYLMESSGVEDTTHCFICYLESGEKHMDDHLSQHNPYVKKKSLIQEEEAKSSKLSTDNKKSDGTRHHCTVEDCGRSYKCKSDLTVHMSSHTGCKSFPCDQCEKKFPTKKQLTAHRLAHSNLTPFSCDYCNYKSKTRCHLLRHTRIHAGSKPYSCPHCEYSSTTIGNLRKHIIHSQKHKGLHMYECTEGGCSFVADTLRAVSQHLIMVHKIMDKPLMTKSTENDWTEIIEGHSIIPVQH